MDYSALAQKNGGSVATATKPGAIDYAALAQKNGATVTPTGPSNQSPTPKPGYFTDPNNGSGILPYSAINDALKPTDVGDTTSPKGATVSNQIKSVAKLGVGVAQFFDPVSIGKTIGSTIGGASNYGTEFEQQKESQQAVKDQIPQLQAAIEKNKKEGKDTSNLERLLKEAGGAPLPVSSPVKEITKETPGALAKTVVPPFIKTALQKAKDAKTSDLAAYVPELQDPKYQGSHLELGARILEGIHAAVQSIAEDPQQLTPYFLALKKPIEKYAPALDTAISKTAKPIIDTAQPIIDKATSLVPDALKQDPKTTYENYQASRQNKAVSDLTGKYRKVFTQFKAPTKAYNKSIAVGKDPAAFGAENGFVVDVQKGKIVAQPTIDKVTTEYVKPRAQLLDEMLQAKDKTIPEWEKFKLDDLATEAKQNVRNNPLLKGSGNLSAVDGTVDKIVAELKKQYGDRVSLYDLNQIKKAQWDQSNSFDLSKPKFEGDVNYALGRAAKDGIEVNVPEASIKQLNGEIGDAQDFIKNLQKVNTQSSPGGAGMTKMFGRTIGTIVGASHGPIGSLMGAAAGNFITELIQNNSIAGPIKRAILENIQPDSTLYNEAQVALEKLKNTPAAQEPGVTTQQTVKPADLTQEPLNPNKPIKVNQFNKPYSQKYITSDQVKSFIDELNLEENSRKVNNLKAKFEGSTVKIRRGTVPMNDIKSVSGSSFKINPDTQPPIEAAGKSFEQISQEAQALEDQGNAENKQALSNETKGIAYSDWPQTTKEAYKQFKKIFNAWKDNPEDYAQLSKTDAGAKLKQQIYNVAKELDINENEVFNLFHDRIVLESQKPSLGSGRKK